MSEYLDRVERGEVDVPALRRLDAVAAVAIAPQRPPVVVERVPGDGGAATVESGLMDNEASKLGTQMLDSQLETLGTAVVMQAWLPSEALEPAISGEALDGLRRRSLALAASRPLYPGLAEPATTR